MDSESTILSPQLIVFQSPTVLDFFSLNSQLSTLNFSQAGVVQW